MRWTSLGTTIAAIGAMACFAGAGIVATTSTTSVAFAAPKKAVPRKATPVRPAPKKPAPTPIVLPPLAAPANLPEPPPGGTILGVGAAIYAAYANDVARATPMSITSEASLATALETLTKHPSERLAKGWMAYGALVVSQGDNFVSEVRKAAAYYGRDVMLTGFKNDIRYARTITGAPQAVDLAQRAFADDADKILAVADQFKAYSYQVQKQPWSQARAANARSLAEGVRAKSNIIVVPGNEIVLAMGAPPPQTLTPSTSLERRMRFWTPFELAATQARLNPLSAGTPAPDPIVATGGVVDRMTTLAAMQALGADVDRKEQMEQLLNARGSSNCFESARLNTIQCVAAGRFHYEQVFCIAEHPLREIAMCIKGAARL
jgi:hypothetical protein